MGLAQPLNVEHGSATLRWSNGYDLASRSLTYASDRVSLNGDRQLLGSVGVSRGAFRLGLVEGVLLRIPTVDAGGCGRGGELGGAVLSKRPRRSCD